MSVEETDGNLGLLINGRRVSQKAAHNRWPDAKAILSSPIAVD